MAVSGDEFERGGGLAFGEDFLDLLFDNLPICPHEELHGMR